MKSDKCENHVILSENFVTLLVSLMLNFVFQSLVNKVTYKVIQIQWKNTP